MPASRPSGDNRTRLGIPDERAGAAAAMSRRRSSPSIFVSMPRSAREADTAPAHHVHAVAFEGGLQIEALTG